VLGLTSCEQSSSSTYGDNYGEYINRISWKPWVIYIDGLEKEQVQLLVTFKPNRTIRYTVLNGSNKGYTFDDAKDRWKVYNEHLDISFGGGIYLKGILSERGLFVEEGSWENNKWERIPLLKYIPIKGTWSGSSHPLNY